MKFMPGRSFLDTNLLVYTDDQHGRRIDGLEIVNPFL